MSPEQMVADVIADLLDLDPGGLTADTPLNGIDGWDSVNALRVLLYLERQAGRQLDYERFAAAATVADVVATVDGSYAREGTGR